MKLSSNLQAQQTRANYPSQASRNHGPDDVPPEFPGRHTEPGPDDVYDPDFGHNRGGDSYDGPHFMESGGGGAWGLF